MKFIKTETKTDLLKEALAELNRILKEYELPSYGSSGDKIGKIFNKQEFEKKLKQHPSVDPRKYLLDQSRKIGRTVPQT